MGEVLRWHTMDSLSDLYLLILMRSLLYLSGNVSSENLL